MAALGLEWRRSGAGGGHTTRVEKEGRMEGRKKGRKGVKSEEGRGGDGQ